MEHRLQHCPQIRIVSNAKRYGQIEVHRTSGYKLLIWLCKNITWILNFWIFNLESRVRHLSLGYYFNHFFIEIGPFHASTKTVGQLIKPSSQIVQSVRWQTRYSKSTNTNIMPLHLCCSFGCICAAQILRKLLASSCFEHKFGAYELVYCASLTRTIIVSVAIFL